MNGMRGYRGFHFIAFLLSLILCIGLLSCITKKTAFHGVVESYDDVKKGNASLFYTINDKSRVKLSQGLARINQDGSFAITFRRNWDLPYSIQIWHVDQRPDLLVAGGNYAEITDDRMTNFDLGTVYIYREPRILGISKGSISLSDLSFIVESDVPNIDHYNAVLQSSTPGNPGHSYVLMFSFKGNHVSLKKASSVIKVLGMHEVGELKIKVGTDKAAGHCVLTIDAVRIENGRPVAVTGTGELTVKIADK